MSRPSRKIGIVCYPSFGGSGVMATEIAMGLARRKHRVHLIATAPPVRLQPLPSLMFHRVDVPNYPLFEYPPYTLALASTIARVTQEHQLDIVFIHYGIPHAISAYLACQMLGSAAPKVVVTLHGTDVTHIGAAENYRDLLRMSLLHCDGITTPSSFLSDAAKTTFSLPDSIDIKVIPNFVDTDIFKPLSTEKRGSLAHLFPNDNGNTNAPVLIHISNFRKVKRVGDVVDIFDKIVPSQPARLVLLGEGPEREDTIQLVASLGLSSRVCFLSNKSTVLEHLQRSDLMLLPSEMESFGLAALEALSCGVPVIASRVGGLPELVEHNKTGFLSPAGDTDAMADAALQLLKHPEQAKLFSQQARRSAVQQWGKEQVLEQIEVFLETIVS